MLHIATSHIINPRWIEIQNRQLREHIPVPYRTWATLALMDASHGRHFDHVIDSQGPEAGKLNHLAFEISLQADDDDLLMFLAGDAFPIADPMELIHHGLSRAPLMAVRRIENGGDRQPHPCFCVSSVGEWRRLAGDWSDGYPWRDAHGRAVTDIGGNLLRRLELSATPWEPVLRTNSTRLDPLFFAIYGGVIYHHGARGGELTRAHRDLMPGILTRPRLPARLSRSGVRLWEGRLQRGFLRRSDELHEKIRAGDGAWLSDVA